MIKKYSLIFIFVVILIVAFWKDSNSNKSGCLYLRVGKVFDGKSSEYWITRDIHISKGQIISISDSQDPPEQCQYIDASAMVAIPGLIDSHTHLFLNSKPDTIGLLEIINSSLNLKNDERLSVAKNNALSMLKSGFTIVRDLGNSGHFLDLKLKHFQEHNPELGPEFITSGPGLAVTPTQAGRNSDEYRTVETFEDAKKFIAENKELGLTWLKIYADNDPEKGLIPAELLKDIVSEAHRQNLKVALHTIEKRGATLGLEYEVDSLEHFNEVPDDPIGNQSKTSIVLTDLSQNQCQNFYKFSSEILYENCAKFQHSRWQRTHWSLEHGFNVVFGSDSYADFNLTRGQSSLESLIALQEEGLKPFQVLQSAGINAAKMLGLTDAGVIQAKARANIVLVEGDPLGNLADLKRIKIVIKDGQVICGIDFSCQEN